MKVIVAGLPKTGTKTMNCALHFLGYNRLYDYPENSYFLHKQWMKIFKEGPTVDLLRQMYDDVDAIFDTPACFYWEELAEAFPEAKIILMDRDEDQWYPSFVKQINAVNSSLVLRLIQNFTLMGISRLNYRWHCFALCGGRSCWPFDQVTLLNENSIRRMFRQHNLYVKERAPKNRLLVYKPSDGWDPLCKFLNVDVPEVPFPHKNKGAEMFEEYRKTNESVKAFERHLVMCMFFYAALVAFLVYKIFTWF